PWCAVRSMRRRALAGGEGPRLRPLTLTLPKPVMPLAGRPFLTFMLDWLRGHGVDDVLLSCGFLAHAVEDVLGDDYEGMQLRYVHEDSPLGTAGPMRLAPAHAPPPAPPPRPPAARLPTTDPP